MRDLERDFVTEKNKLQSAAVITLYDVQLDESTWIYVCNWTASVTFDSQTYTPIAIKRGAISHDSSGKITSMSLTVGNVSRVISGYLETYDGMIGMKVIVTTVFANLLDDPNSKVVEEFYIKTAVADESKVTFSLVAKLDILDVFVPRRKFTRNFCQWEYKRDGCWLTTGATFEAAAGFNNTPLCDRTLGGASGCEFHTNEERFGGFPGIPQNLNVIRI